MDLFKLPRTLGERDGDVCTVGIGRFGPYVRLGATYASLTPEDDPLEIDLRRAVELIDLKKTANATRDLGEYKGEMIVEGRGRFGPFVKYGKTLRQHSQGRGPGDRDLGARGGTDGGEAGRARQNILKEFDGLGHPGARWSLWSVHHRRQQERQPAQGEGAEDVTLEEATALLAAAPEKKGGERRGGARKSAAKKAAPKKAAAKKAAPKKAAAKKAAPKKAAKKKA